MHQKNPLETSGEKTKMHGLPSNRDYKFPKSQEDTLAANIHKHNTEHSRGNQAFWEQADTRKYQMLIRQVRPQQIQDQYIYGTYK